MLRERLRLTPTERVERHRRALRLVLDLQRSEKSRAWEVMKQDEARAEPVALYGYKTWVLSLEGLIASKEATGRVKDLRLLPELRVLLQLRDSRGSAE